MHDLPSKTEMLASLHYNPKWLEYGFLDEMFLRQQFSKYIAGLDENLEHYRYESFQRIIDAPAVDDVKVDQYIELAELDEDKAMARAALAHLVKHSGLTEQQWLRIRSHPAFTATDLQALVERTELLSLLASSEITHELFERALSSGDQEVQRRLLNDVRLSRQQLTLLAQQGSNRAIRNTAKERVRRL